NTELNPFTNMSCPTFGGQYILDQSLGSIFLKEKGMSIDLGALAKGYIADKLMAFLIKDGITAALINLGGNILVHGTNKQRHNGLFYVGIQQTNQKRGQHVGVIKVNNKSVVTSGIGERQLQIKDKTYHHLLDPHNGYPIKTNMASLTIVSQFSLDGELWSSRLFGLEHSFVLSQLNKLPEVEGIIITKDGQVTISDGLKGAFRLHYKH
ncbi:FAD:protein FMN transferase, partial [Streptococcus equi]